MSRNLTVIKKGVRSQAKKTFSAIVSPSKPKAFKPQSFADVIDHRLCLHITNDPKIDAEFCDQPRVPGRSYCQRHTDLCIVIIKKEDLN